MNESDLADYRELLVDIKNRVRAAQRKAALSANAAMILMYWDVGRMIAGRQAKQGWGAKVIPRLSVDLKNELPEEKGFSERNISRMIAFFRAYPDLPRPAAKLTESRAETRETPGNAILPRPVAKLNDDRESTDGCDIFFLIPWSHNIVLIEKVKDFPNRFWYARQAAEQGWSRDRLTGVKDRLVQMIGELSQ